MTAASIGRSAARVGVHPLVSEYALPVAAATTIYQGTLVSVALSGTDANYCTPTVASLTVEQRVVGVALQDAVNTSAAGFGSAGAINVKLGVGLYRFNMGSSTDALTAAMVGEPVYASDDNTVNRTRGSTGNRPFAGILRGVEGSLATVEVGTRDLDATGVDILLAAAADYSSSGQHTFMDVNSSGAAVQVAAAGAKAVGVLQNAPASGAIAIVRVFGQSRVLASATINPGVILASTNAGLSKDGAEATADASGASATAAITGSYNLGVALTAGANGSRHLMLVNPIGATPGTAA